MDRLRVIENDYTLLGGKGLRWGTLRWGTIWSIFRCTAYQCPYCRWIFKITWGPYNSLLGSGERVCWHCKQIFWDGSQEWQEMTSDDRMQYFMPISMAGYLGAFLVVAGLYVYMLLALKKSPDIGAIIFFVAFFLPIACWIVFRIIQIFRSVRRYNSRGSSATT